MRIQGSITSKLNQHLAPTHLEVINESHMHSVPKNSETHFLVIIVSANFEGLNRVQRGQKVHEILADELKNGVHALSTRLLTPSEWEAKNRTNPFASPQCASKKTDSGI